MLDERQIEACRLWEVGCVTARSRRVCRICALFIIEECGREGID